MENLLIKKCTVENLEEVKYISEKTFCETFAKENTEEDMANYLRENFSYQKIISELESEASIFFMVKVDEEIAGYMKVNFEKAQTESNYQNTLEIQRVYILSKYKGNGIGKVLIEKAKEVARKNNLSYIWLGVWEKNFSAIKFYEKQGFEKFATHIFQLGDDKQIDNLMKFVI